MQNVRWFPMTMAAVAALVVVVLLVTSPTSTPAGDAAAKDDGAQSKPAEAKPAAKEEVEPADNSYCIVCHLNYETEKLSIGHQIAAVGCAKCHGESKKHSGDEDGLTAPDVIFGHDDVDVFCMTCHPKEKIVKNDNHKDFFDPKVPADEHLVCTECHAENHKMAVRTRKWDKKTRKLLSDDGVRMMYKDSRATEGVEEAKKKPAKDFPLGVYWPWERTEGTARNAGLERWDFVEKTCRLLKENGVDAVWVVNIDVQDTKKLLKVTQAAGLMLLPCLGEIEVRNRPETSKVVAADPKSMEQAMDYYRRTVPQVMQAIGDDRAGVLAWVLGDEPSGDAVAILDPMRTLFAEADPDRPVITVSMWPQTPTLIEKTRLTTFCVDLYPFFGPNDPNGPHTPAASANFYTTNILKMVEGAGKDGRVGWVMPQCFNEIWGPWEMRSDGVTVALPGSYYHWRTPTEGEIRWQTWEALRCGAKGVFFFVLLAQDKGNPDAKPVDDPTLKDVLIKTPTVVGYDALLDFQGRPTSQFTAASEIFRKLAQQKDLLRRLSPSSTAWLTADAGIKIGCFLDPQTKERYAFVVNADMAASQTAQVTAAESVKGIEDVFDRRPLQWESSASPDGIHHLKIELKAGDGAFLRVL